MLKSIVVMESIPMLSVAFTLFANPLVRNMSTIGGNIAAGSQRTDRAPTLRVLKTDETWELKTI